MQALFRILNPIRSLFVSQFDYIRPYVANDNSPTARTPLGDAVGFNAVLRERQKQRREQEAIRNSESNKERLNLGLTLSSVIWIGFMIATLWSFYTSQPTGTRIFGAIGLIWSGLWTRYLALDHDKPRLAEVTLLSTLVGFMSLLLTASLQMGYPLSLPGGLMIFIGAALLVSCINDSVTALICAIAGCLFWAAMQIDGYVQSGAYSFAVPAILALTVFQGLRLKSGLSIIVMAVVGYMWLAGSAFSAFNSGQISILFLATGAVLVGNAHYRAAKAAEDEKLAYTQWQVAFGWIVANTGLLTLARYGLDPTDVIWSGMDVNSPIMRIAWLGVIGLSLSIYIVSGIVRTRHKHMNLAGVIMTSLMLLCLPLSIWYLNTFSEQFQSLTNLDFYPNSGLFLFGLVSGNIIFFIFNAFRRHHYWKVAVALMALSMLAYTASGIDLLHQENWVTWFVGILASLIVALIAVEPQLATDNEEDQRTSVSSS